MSSEIIEIILNGEMHKSGAKTLYDLILSEKLELIKVATAVNGEFVPIHARRNTLLKSGDLIEILTIRQGG